jgi:type IV secretion system protein VirB5
MQGLRMVQQAQLEVVKQRSEEDWRRRVDTMGAAAPGTPSQ